MAPRTEIDEHTAIGLHALLANVDDLPQVAEEWDELPDGERASWGLDWGHLMLGYLPEVDRAYRAGLMTPEQQRQYRGLLRNLRDALPILERLNLTRPPVPLPDQGATVSTHLQHRQ